MSVKAFQTKTERHSTQLWSSTIKL